MVFEPGLLGDFRERPVAIVMEEPVGRLALEQAAQIVRNEQIEKSVAVIIDPGSGKARTPNLESGLLRDIGKGAVAIVVEQLALSGIKAETRNKDVGKAVVVVIAHRDPVRVDARVEPGTDRDIGESAVAVIVVKSGAAEGGSDRDIEETIVVVIEDRPRRVRRSSYPGRLLKRCLRTQPLAFRNRL